MTLHFRGTAWSPALHRYAERLAHGIPEQIEATMSRADDGFFELKLLHRPSGRELITHDRSEHAALALDGAFGALRRELAVPAGSSKIRPFGDPFRKRLAEEVLPAARRIAHHEVLLRQRTGEVEAGEIDPDELVDMAAAELLPEASETDSEVLVEQFDARIHALLAERASEVERHMDDLSTDRHVQPWAPTGTRTLWDELQTFWVLDESMHLEDLLEDTSAKNPALMVEEKEVRHVLVTALFELSRAERQLFARVVTDGADPAALAEFHETTHADIDALVHGIAQKLADAMPRLTQGDTGTVRALYQELGDTLKRLPRY